MCSVRFAISHSVIASRRTHAQKCASSMLYSCTESLRIPMRSITSEAAPSPPRVLPPLFPNTRGRLTLQPCGSKVSSFTRYPSVLELYSKWSPYVIEERAPDLSFIISFGDRQDIVSVIDFLNERVRKTKRVFDFATQRETTFVDLFSFLLGLTVCVHFPDSCSVSCSMLQIIKRYVAKDHNGSHS